MVPVPVPQKCCLLADECDVDWTGLWWRGCALSWGVSGRVQTVAACLLFSFSLFCLSLYIPVLFSVI
jgi:hypothetical protein